ncbi:MAG: multi-sensor signal transduction histidine kinase [Rhodospirillales bacterium]|nr:multi-sensor signal transduction histidine kinase [Rhodospirillales bacterium]
MSERHVPDQWLHMFETAMRTAPDAVLITDNVLDDSGAKILFVNDAFLRMSGYARSDLLGRPSSMLRGARTDREATARVSSALASGKPVQEDLLHYKKDGKSFWAGYSFSLLRDAAGHEAYFLCVGRDITQRKRAENEKKAAEELLSAVFAGVDVGVLVQDEAGVVVLANPAVSRLVRLRISDLIGRSLDEFLDRKAPDVVTTPPPALAAHGTSQRQIHWHNPNGENFELQLRSTNMRLADGRRLRVLTLQDLGTAASRDERAEFQRAIQQRPGGAYPATLIAGHVRLVGLGEVRSAFGDEWPQMAGRSHEIAAQIIREHLTAGDVYAPAQDDSYVLCFAVLNELEAARQANLIAQEIRLTLLREFGDTAITKITAHAAKVELNEQETDDGGQALVDLVSAKLTKARQILEGQARTAIRQAMQDEVAEFHRVVTAGQQQSQLWLVQLPGRVQSLVDRSRHMLPSQPEVTLEVDAYLLGKAAELLFADCNEGGAPFLIVPVDWRSLSQRREAGLYLGLCRELAEPVRRRIFFEITGLPNEIGQTRMGETIGRLRQFGRGVAIEIAGVDKNHMALSEYRVDFLTLDERAIHLDRDVDRIQLARLQKGLRLWKSRLLVKNVQHGAACKQLAAAGIELMTGAPFVGRPIDESAVKYDGTQTPAATEVPLSTVG